MRTACTLLLTLALALAADAQSWMAAAPMGTARSGAAAVVLDGRLVVMGGRDAAGTPLGTAEAFDLASGWTPLPPLRRARTDAAAAVLDGRIVLAGGRDDEGEPTDDVEVYDPALDRWESFEHMETEREGHGLAVLGTAVVAIGGASEGGTLLGSAEAYDGDWEELAGWTLSPGRARFGTVGLGDGLVVVGGFSAFGPVRAVRQFASDGTPTNLPDLPTARGGLAAATDGSALFAVGGRDASDAVRAEVDRLAAGAGAWTTVTPLPQAREGAVAAVIGTDLIVAGGSDAFGGVLASVVVLPLEGVDTLPGPPGGGPSLSLAGPNPTRGATAVEVRSRPADPVRLVVVDVLGREIAVLAQGPLESGAVRIPWAADVPAGTYAVVLTTAGRVTSVRVTVVR